MINMSDSILVFSHIEVHFEISKIRVLCIFDFKSLDFKVVLVLLKWVIEERFDVPPWKENWSWNSNQHFLTFYFSSSRLDNIVEDVKSFGFYSYDQSECLSRRYFWRIQVIIIPRILTCDLWKNSTFYLLKIHFTVLQIQYNSRVTWILRSNM